MVQLMSLGFRFDNLMVYLFSFIVSRGHRDQDSDAMTASVYAGRESSLCRPTVPGGEETSTQSMCNAQGLDRQDPICISIYKGNPFTPQETWSHFFF